MGCVSMSGMATYAERACRGSLAHRITNCPFSKHKPTNEMVRRLIPLPEQEDRKRQLLTRRIIARQIHSVGIDLGKTTFHLVALGASGKVLVKKKFTQKQLLVFTANMQTSLIGLEACSGAHFLGRALRKQGHDVRLIPAH